MSTMRQNSTDVFDNSYGTLLGSTFFHVCDT